MKVGYKYASPSQCTQVDNHATLGLSPDLSRDEKVSFCGKLKHPLLFRDAMLMLREIVISDTGKKSKERTDYFIWLNEEIERRVKAHKEYMPNVRESLKKKMNSCDVELLHKKNEINQLLNMQRNLQKQIDQYDAWKDYYKIERDFWKFIKDRDYSLWFVLDPVITVHNDQVSFEAFSVDESIYGCLSVSMNEFDLLQTPKLGTTNIDFSAKLEKEIQRFRSYTDVTLSVNPEGFTVDSDIVPEYIEKKIDLPETWIKGFNQVSSAAALSGIELELSPSDMYDICAFLRKHKEKKSPRYMKWILEPEQKIQIVFEPFGTVLTLNAVYHGSQRREEKIWGRRRWLVVEKLIPLSKAFYVRILGFGMPQFIRADMGTMQMTVGFSSWSSNDWVKGTAFNIMAGFTGEGCYKDIYKLLKEKRCLSMKEISSHLSNKKGDKVKAGIGMLLRRGEGYFDITNNKVRFRHLCNTPIPEELYEVSDIEMDVQKISKLTFDNMKVRYSRQQEFIFTTTYKEYGRLSSTEIVIDQDGQITKIDCSCQKFKRGERNLSEPCAHILALYVASYKLLKLKNLEYEKEYKINDIMEMLL
ncbi:SWIM zinc finger family protein [Lachnospiraceae bacterium 48-33]